MCKITAPKNIATAPPLSWEELHNNDLLVADLGVAPFEKEKNSLTGDDRFSNEFLFNIQTDSFSSNEYCDMSMFGLFPQQDSTFPAPDVAFNDQVLFELPMQNSVMQQLDNASSPTDATSFLLSSNGISNFHQLPKKSGVDSPKSSKSVSSRETTLDPQCRLQKRKLGNTNAKKSDEGTTEEVRNKRQKQREAAKRCREKRLGELQIAEDRAAKAEAEKLELLIRVKVLESEKKNWMEMEKQLQKEIYNLSHGKMQMQF